MPRDLWLWRLRRVEVVLGLLLAAVSFAPWWTRRDDGSGATAWSGPHLSWLAVLLCLAVVAARALPGTASGDRLAGLGEGQAAGLGERQAAELGERWAAGLGERRAAGLGERWAAGLGERWAAVGVGVALVGAGYGWVAELSGAGGGGTGSGQLGWVLQDQGADGPVRGLFDVAWGYGAGLGLMALLLAALVVAGRRGRG